MKDSGITAFLKANIEPLARRNGTRQFRAAAYLYDGLYLPCVVFQNGENYVDHLLERFADPLKEPDEYRNVVSSILTKGSTISSHMISRVELSPFAWPIRVLEKIHGETVMGYTIFVAEMNDGKRFSYCVPSMGESFYDLPSGYRFDDIKEIYSAMVYSDSHGMESYYTSYDLRHNIKYLENKPCFYCYIGKLDE